NAGYQYSTAGENVAAGYLDAEAVVAGWMGSEGHRANILNASFEELGVGYGTSDDGTSYWTQNFGSEMA
ncbi:MAG: CAP domain-containing protein, partial [Waterburya sp.]